MMHWFRRGAHARRLRHANSAPLTRHAKPGWGAHRSRRARHARTGAESGRSHGAGRWKFSRRRTRWPRWPRRAGWYRKLCDAL